MDSLIIPDWPVPDFIKAFVTTRQGGVSVAPYDSFNMGAHVGDLPEHVQLNRQRLASLCELPSDVQWLNQVHSCVALSLPTEQSERTADACFTRNTNTICAVLTADCLPVLFCDVKRRQVAAAHAGWRGLCDGVLESTLGAFENPQDVLVWLGPAIGPDAFEVGAEVRTAFMDKDAQAENAFKPAEQQGKWLGDLYLLAKQRLGSMGCHHIYGGEFCTLTDQERFFSYRRDGVTGRMATLIWLED